MITDLTVGSPSRLILRFTLPLLISSVFQQLYGISDLIIAGNLIGMNALAAIGASVPVTMTFMAIAQGCNIGCSVTISQLFGSRETVKMKTAIYTSLIGVLVMATFLLVLGITFCGTIMTALNTPADIFDDAALYLNIYIGGLIFLFLYNICNGICTALGDSRTPLYFLIASSVGNVLLDLLFVKVFEMGVAGTAWATFICQGICSILALTVLLKRLWNIKIGVKVKLFSASILLRILKIAVPSILQQSFVSVGNLFVQGLINSFGPAVIAGFSSASRINTFALTSIGSLGNGLSSFTAQNIGGGKYERVRSGFKACLVFMSIMTIFFTVLFLIFRNNLIGLFVDSSAEDTNGAISAGAMFISIISPFYITVAVKLIADGVLRGSGSMLYFMIATFSDLILRVFLSYILSPIFGEKGICYSWPIGWIIGGVFSLFFYFRVTRHKLPLNNLS